MKVETAIIGGTGLETILSGAEKIRVGTPYGFPSPIVTGEISGKSVAFLARHGFLHSTPPHKINYRANIYALHKIGVKTIIATNAVGAINPRLKTGDLVVPHDLIDFTRVRQSTFYEEAPVTHVDMSQTYCPEMRKILIRAAMKHFKRVHSRGVLVCTEGPRYETPAEIRMFRQLGCDIVGMTSMPETSLARELEICYATVCYISNMAAGMKKRLTAHEVRETAKHAVPVIQKILRDTVRLLPKRRRCPCASALKHARFRG